MATSQMSNLTLRDLQQVINELGERYPQFPQDDLFVLWFLRAYVTEEETRAANAITGGSRDKGVDALLIDDASRGVFLVQGKYREQLARRTEGRSEVMAFADLADFLHRWDEEACNAFLADTDDAVAEQLRVARKKVQRDKYRSWLHFITTGKVSLTVCQDAQQKARRAGPLSRLEVIDGHRAMLLFRDYLDGCTTDSYFGFGDRSWFRNYRKWCRAAV